MTHASIPRMAAVMTPFPYHIDARATAREARAMMAEHGIHHLAVMENGVLESILSERDIRWAGQPGHPLEADYLVSDLCPPRAYIVDIGDPLDRVLDAMGDKGLGAVLVTREGELAGIFTDRDACHYLARRLREDHDNPPDQAA